MHDVRDSDCLLTSEHGVVRTYHVPQLKGGLAMPKMLELQEFAASLRAGMIVVFQADDADIGMEGVYWLAQLRSAAFPCPASLVHASDQVEAGWLVVKAQW